MDANDSKVKLGAVYECPNKIQPALFHYDQSENLISVSVMSDGVIKPYPYTDEEPGRK